MTRTTTLIIGGGQAGLAMSRCLSDRGIDHVVLERGQVAQRWRSHSWDSLRLLTPNWMTRLPGFHYDGHDPDGFMSVPELIAFFERYAVSLASSVVVATGYCDLPAVPAASRGLAPSVRQIVPSNYRRPEQLPPGGVL